MGIFDRLGDVIKSYLNDEDSRVFGHSRPQERRRDQPFGDPDVDAAFEELDEFLNRGSGKQRDSAWEELYRESGGSGSSRSSGGQTPRPAPETLRPDFEELKVPFGASRAECKAAYKKLLKMHHPDRHAGHAGNMKKATDKSARINASYERIERWRETGKTD